VPPFVTARLGIFGVLKEIGHQYKNFFGAVHDFVKKADLSKGYENPKRKLRVTTHFSEMIWQQ